MIRTTGLLATAGVLLLAAAAPARAKSKVRCDSGTAIFVDGQLRIFGVAFHEGSSRTGEASGHDLYACLGTRGPFGVGQEFSSTGTASADTPAFVFAGGRYLGAAHVDDGEGGPTSYYEIYNLARQGRRIAFRRGSFGGSLPEFGVTSAGRLVSAEESIVFFDQGVKGDGRELSAHGVEASDPALTGTALYWTEHPAGLPSAPRSAIVPGDAAAGEGAVYAPVGFRPRGGRCTRRSGTTVARSPSVRVFERKSSAGSARRYACRLGSNRLTALRPRSIVPDMRSTALQTRVVGDRWLFTLDGPRAATAPATATVYDTRSGKAVTTATATSFRTTTVAAGTLAWIDATGTLMGALPGKPAVVLAPAVDGPGALASSAFTLYWTTADGKPHSRPPGSLITSLG